MTKVPSLPAGSVPRDSGARGVPPAGPGYLRTMSSQTYAITHVVGTSPDGVDQAIRNGLGTASKSVRNLDWFEVDEIRGHLAGDGTVAHFQVTLKLGFRLDDSD